MTATSLRRQFLVAFISHGCRRRRDGLGAAVDVVVVAVSRR